MKIVKITTANGQWLRCYNLAIFYNGVYLRV